MRHRTSFQRNFDATDLVEIFLVAAVTAILGIRFFLRMAGYPQLGGDALHIAHMLWGGLLMLAAMVMLFLFLGRTTTRLAALVGGLGFGTFIDEVGKFVTHDNDYFYQPSVALIYATFVFALLAIRAIQARSYTRTEYLLNALRELEEVALHDLDEQELRRAMNHLDRADPTHPLVPAIRDMLQETELVPVPQQDRLARLRIWIGALYLSLTRRRTFVLGLVIFFAGQFLIRLAYVIALIQGWRLDPDDPMARGWLTRVAVIDPGLDFLDGAQLVTSLLSGVFVGLGIFALRASRLRAYEMFRRSVLVTIFLTQVFLFYREEFSALLGLLFNILLLLALELMIRRERDHTPCRAS
jgi:hypothetical protein